MTHPTPPHQTARACRHHSQGGFTLIELGLSLSIAAVVIASSLVWLNYQTRLDEGRAAGQILGRINASVGTYLADYYTKLTTLPVHCSVLDWEYSSNGNSNSKTPTAYADCSFTLTLQNQTSYTIHNGMQPTLADLQMIGALDTNINDILPFPTRNAMVGTFGNTIQTIPPRYAILIEQICLAEDKTTPINATPVSATNNPAAKATIASFGPTSCPSGEKDLRSLVFNSQPYATESFGGSFMGQTMLSTAFLAAGGDAALSGDIGTGQSPELEGLRGSFSAKNPLRKNELDPTANKTSSTGVANILAMRNGYGSSAFMQLTRRDGSSRPTADWNFDGYAITNVKRLDATQIDTDTLNVNKSFIANGAADFKDKTSVFQFKLNAESTLGTACNPSIESLRLQTENNTSEYNKGLRLLVCDKASSKWVMSQQNFQSSIDSLTSDINELKKTTNLPTYEYQYYTDRDAHDTGWDCDTWGRPVVSTWDGNGSGNTIEVWPQHGDNGKCTWYTVLHNSQCCNGYGIVSFKAKYNGTPPW